MVHKVFIYLFIFGVCVCVFGGAGGNVGVASIEEMMIDRHKMVWSRARGFMNRDSMLVFRVMSFFCM